MKNYLKNMVAIGAAAFTLFTASPAVYATNKTQIADEHRVISQYYQLEHQKEKINKELTNINKEIKQKNIKVNSFKPYGKDLTLEDYTKIIESTEKYSLKEGGFETFIRLERVLKEEQFMDKVAEYYHINKQDMIRIWNQESNFYIKALGKQGERGMAQFKEQTAKLVLDRLISPGDSLYFEWKRFYPEFNIKKYDFKKLSEDYKLNIIMTASQVRINSSMLDYFLKKAGINKNQLIKIVKQKGTTADFEKLREVARNPKAYGLNPEFEKTIKNYNISNQRIAEVHKIYRVKGHVLPGIIDYIMHNGGEMAVQNIITDTFAGELLTYHLAMYMNNLGGLYNLMNYHYDSLENMVKSHESLVKNLTVGNTIDLWGNEVKKVDIQKLKTYSQHGLIERINSDLLEKDQLTIMKDYAIDENLKLHPIDKKLIKLCTIDNIDELYGKLIMFKQLEELQTSLNKAYETKDQKSVKDFGPKVTFLETEMNKRFQMKRAHTGIAGVQKDISQLEEELKNAGFTTDFKKYQSMILSKPDQNKMLMICK
jgi:hypothetical protein